MMGSRVLAGPDPALGTMTLSQFLQLAGDADGFATKLAEIRTATEEMSRQQSVLATAQAEHDAREAGLSDRARDLDSRTEAVRNRESKCITSEAETGRRQQEQDTRAASLAQQSAALERREQLVSERKTALKQEMQRVAQSIDALNRTVEG
jgi:chromosome segregation ATPase